MATASKRGSQDTAAARKKRVQEMRKAQLAQERRRQGLLVAGVGGAALAVVVALVLVAVLGRPGTAKHAGLTGSAAQQILPAFPTGPVTVEKSPRPVANSTGIAGVLAWDTQGWPGNGTSHPGAIEHQHVTGPVRYSVTPPVGGPHNATWMNAGVYTKPIPAERAVHNLEHGAIWITYDPNLPQAEVTALMAFVTRQSLIPETQQASGIANDANRYMDMSPWPTNTLPAPIVLSAWGYQLRVSSPADPRMQRFVNLFRNSSKYAPEYGSAVDGIPVLTGGRPAYDGSTQPNPPGH